MRNEKGICRSMRRMGNCHGNSMMENFSRAALSTRILTHGILKSCVACVMDCYNNWRIQTRRKGLPPALHRQQALLKAGRLRVGSIYPAFWVTSRLVQRAKHLLCNGIFRLSQPFRSCSKVVRTAPGPWFSRLKSSTTKALRPAAFKSTPQIEASSSREPKSS